MLQHQALLACYYKRRKPRGESLFNRVAAFFSPSDEIHCELYFRREHEATAIDCVTRCTRLIAREESHYTPDAWRGFNLHVTRWQYQAIREFCANHTYEPFSLARFACVPCGECIAYHANYWRTSLPATWTCATFTTTALCCVEGVMRDRLAQETCTLTPADLFRAMRDAEQTGAFDVHVHAIDSMPARYSGNGAATMYRNRTYLEASLSSTFSPV